MDGPDRTPEIRVSDKERNDIASLLNDAVGEGRITLDEYTERVGQAYAATTRGELDVLIADLPVARSVMGEGGPSPVPVAAPGTEVDQPEGKRKWRMAIMGGDSIKGRWRVRRRQGFFALMGGDEIDMRDAQLDAPVVELVLVSIMGGHTVVVPKGVRVEHEGGFNLMGGTDIKIDESAVHPHSPTVRIRSYSFMGGNEIKNPKEKKKKK
ncbi:DUF1707 domain-containing protein [Actinoalloteichus sp. AHMU CJ021]|nr:DUF1707 domain-containing protein [Actinoalloteichus caeruleus]AUS80684.1 DUF1707 domain-containing protein [Actinoalloteichus sp. AHMU CJ021]